MAAARTSGAVPLMSFPYWVEVGAWRLHPHLVFELLAYTIGFQLFLLLRRRGSDPLPSATRWPLVAAAMVGAVVGSKLLAWLIDLEATWVHLHDPVYLMGGKTIMGGLAGGLIAVEGTKRLLGVTRATGDLYALPLVVGIAIGRIGCFLTGLPDRTYGIATTLPWGVDFGDGILRHPTQLYEIAFLVLLGGFIMWRDRCGQTSEGGLFRVFMVGYFGWRFVVSFLQPFPVYAGLQTLQWAALLVLAYYAVGAWRRRASGRTEPATGRDAAHDATPVHLRPTAGDTRSPFGPEAAHATGPDDPASPSTPATSTRERTRPRRA